MRTMKSGNIKLKVKAWYMLRNGWEFYVTKLPDKNGIGEALVLGDYDEIGSFSAQEIKPYIVSSVFEQKELMELAPAPGYHWVD